MNSRNIPSIFVNQKGFTPDSAKYAVIPFPCDKFNIINTEGNVVFTSSVTRFGPDKASGDDVYTADFSAFRQSGRYIVHAAGKKSAVFEIRDDIYKDVTRDTLRAFYYLRCGCGLDMRYAGLYEHPPCHTAPAVLWDDHSVSMDVTGGWHDAGDYGRYVTAGAVALAHMLYGFRMFPESYEDIKTGIPDSSDIPDLLTECRVELEWIMKMQREDGGVYHKATTKGHAGFVMPEQDTAQMYVLPVSSMATADTAAVCALAAGIYEKYDTDFAAGLKKCAEKAYENLIHNPDFLFDPTRECTTGGYGERSDRDNRCWAAAELYALTGDKHYHDDFLRIINEDINRTALGWGETGGFASLCYILSDRPDKEMNVHETLKAQFMRRADELVTVADSCGYGAAMNEHDYYWGSNMGLLKNAMIFIIASILSGDERYESYIVRQMDYLLGCNAVGISYVTGIGEYSVNNPHYRPAAADGIEKCHEGFVSGGPNSGRNDTVARSEIREGTPPMKCFIDHTGSYSTNEVAIYWNSPAVFTAGYLRKKNK